jgi:hypothetical protein
MMSIEYTGDYNDVCNRFQLTQVTTLLYFTRVTPAIDPSLLVVSEAERSRAAPSTNQISPSASLIASTRISVVVSDSVSVEDDVTRVSHQRTRRKHKEPGFPTSRSGCVCCTLYDHKHTRIERIATINKKLEAGAAVGDRPSDA